VKEEMNEEKIPKSKATKHCPRSSTDKQKKILILNRKQQQVVEGRECDVEVKGEKQGTYLLYLYNRQTKAFLIFWPFRTFNRIST